MDPNSLHYYNPNIDISKNAATIVTVTSWQRPPRLFILRLQLRATIQNYVSSST